MKKFMIYKLLIVLLMGIVGAYFYKILPDTVPTHWGFDGKPDSFGSKNTIIFGIPLITLVMILLFPLFSKIDPKAKNYEKFNSTWEIMQFTIIGLFAYLYFLSIYMCLNPEKSINAPIMIGIGIMFMIIGNYLGKVKQNFFIGIKFPWTLSSEEVWNKTHRLSGKLFVLSGLVLLVNSYFQYFVFYVFIVITILIILVPIIYSYLEYQKEIK